MIKLIYSLLLTTFIHNLVCSAPAYHPIISVGDEAMDENFPYQARVVPTFPDGSTGTCGGTLIERRWVVTASHCLQTVRSGQLADVVQVEVGSILNYNIGDDDRITLTSYNFTVHPDSFQNGEVNASFDIGLIYLPASVGNTPKIWPLSLPDEEYGDFVGIRAVASGWGETFENSPLAITLQYLTMDVLTQEECLDFYGSDIVTESILCAAGVNDKGGTCAGDSGGPLVYQDHNPYLLIGIASFIPDDATCDSGVPRGFVRITSHLEWIQSVSGIKPFNFIPTNVNFLV